MKTLYVHIGTMKTGTTAIQSFCWGNRDVLNKYRYCYPDFHDLASTATRKRNGCFLVEEYETVEKEKEVFRTGMDRVIEMFSQYDNVILSNEGIWGATLQRRAGLWEELKSEGEKAGFQVKIIVYLRRQDEYLSSCWNQMVKMGTVEGVRKWDEYLNKIPKGRQLDYDKKLDGIAAVLGKENIIVRCYDWKKFYGGSIYADFLHIIGLSLTDEYVIEREIVNTKLAGNMHEIKRIINTMPMVDKDSNFYFRDILLECSNDSQVEQNYSMFSKEEAEEFIKKYEDGNRRVAVEYMGIEDGSLFSQTVKDAPKWEKENPNVQDDMVRFVCAACMRLKSENEQLKGELDKMERRVKKLEERTYKLRHPVRTVCRKVQNKEK